MLLVFWKCLTTTTKWMPSLTKKKPTMNFNATRRKHHNVNFTLKNTEALEAHSYYRLRYSVPQPPDLYGLPKLHKPGKPMRPIVPFCGSQHTNCQHTRRLYYNPAGNSPIKTIGVLAVPYRPLKICSFVPLS